jgi:hypothetical protein
VLAATAGDSLLRLLQARNSARSARASATASVADVFCFCTEGRGVDHIATLWTKIPFLTTRKAAHIPVASCMVAFEVTDALDIANAP